MTTSRLCLECINFQNGQCRRTRTDPGKLPCRNYALDPQLVSDQDIEPGDQPPSLKDHKPDRVKPLVPDADLVTNKVKADRFKRLATPRLAKTLDDMRKLGNLSAKANYEWTQEQVDVMVGRIRSAADELRKKFNK